MRLQSQRSQGWLRLEAKGVTSKKSLASAPVNVSSKKADKRVPQERRQQPRYSRRR